MTNITNFQDILGAANGDKTSVLGKFLYFSLANILVEKEARRAAAAPTIPSTSPA